MLKYIVFRMINARGSIHPQQTTSTICAHITFDLMGTLHLRSVTGLKVRICILIQFINPTCGS